MLSWVGGRQPHPFPKTKLLYFVYQSWLSCFCISVDWPWNLLVMGSYPVWGSKAFLSASTAVYHSHLSCTSSCSSQQMKWSVQWTTCTVNAVMDSWWYLWRLATLALSFKTSLTMLKVHTDMYITRVFNTVNFSFIWTLHIPWIFMVTAFCKYETHPKLMISFWTRAYSGLCIEFMNLHPGEGLALLSLEGCSWNTQRSNRTEIDSNYMLEVCRSCICLYAWSCMHASHVHRPKPSFPLLAVEKG